MLIHKCRKCGFESKRFKEYFDHLWAWKHQSGSRGSFLNWSGDDNLRSLVVYAPSKVPPPTPSEVISMFLKVNVVVVDFVFWIHMPFLFVVQFPSRRDVETVLGILHRQSSDLTIGGECVQLRRKSDVLQNEWAILVGDGTAQEGISRDPVLIELSDDAEEELPQNSSVSSLRSRPRTQSASVNEINNTEKVSSEDAVSSSFGMPETTRRTRSSTPRGEPEPETSPAVQQPNSSNSAVNGDPECSSTTSFSSEETISDIKIATKISKRFVSTFLSKVKQESADDKSKVQENLRWMEKKWAEIYLSFHNKFWPICFVMSNSNVKTKKIENIGFEATFRCQSLSSEYNEWLRKKADDYEALAKEKVIEFKELLQNETECNRRLKKMAKAGRPSKPGLNFTCHILVTFHNTDNTKAELTIKNIEGKRLEKKMRMVQTIFREVFKDYEKVKIKKWSAAEAEAASVNVEEWTTLVTVE